MTDNAADGRAITEIQMGAAAAPEPTVVVAATLADAAGLACQDTTRPWPRRLRTGESHTWR